MGKNSQLYPYMILRSVLVEYYFNELESLSLGSEEIFNPERSNSCLHYVGKYMKIIAYKCTVSNLIMVYKRLK